jgi:ABC-type multidrug transport system fused ATPase/permease subunit
VFKHLEHKVFFFATMALVMLSLSADLLLTPVQGNLAKMLVKSDSELPEDFMDPANPVCAEMIGVIVFMVVLGLTSRYFEANHTPYLRRDLRVAIQTAILSQDRGFFDRRLGGRHHLAAERGRAGGPRWVNAPPDRLCVRDLPVRLGLADSTLSFTRAEPLYLLRRSRV